MHRITYQAVALAAILMFAEGSAMAQMGTPSVPGMGGIGGQSSRPRRKLKRNQSPALSPALNMVPGVATSFEGQFLLRTLPHEQSIRSTAQFNRQIQGLQNQATEQEAEIKSGISKTGHSSRFMYYGSYYSFGGAGGRRGQ